MQSLVKHSEHRRKWYFGIISQDNQMILAAAIASFLSGFVFQHDEIYKLNLCGGAVIASCAAVGLLLLYICRADTEKKRLASECMILSAFTLVLMQLVSWISVQELYDTICVWGSIMTAVILLALGILFWRWEGGVTENTVTLTIAAGFLFRLFYNVMLQATFVQHDTGALESWNYGHLGYIYYILTQWKLPDVNPMSSYQFYHPPLYHFISAVWIKIYSCLGLQESLWDEALQMLPMFFITALLIYLNKLGKLLNCSVFGRFVAVGLAAFFPYSIFMGGSLNNDTLMTLLMVMSIYYTVKWYQDPKMRNILLMAVCVGCAMMTKLSGVLVAPGMAIVMLWRLVQDRYKWSAYVKQFICFGLVSFPLGLWYSVLRYLQYGMPFGYVLQISESEGQYIGQYTKLQRFQDYKFALGSLSVRVGYYSGGIADYNIPVTTIKTGVFSTLDYYTSNAATLFLGTTAFWTTAFLFVLFGIAYLLWLFMKERDEMIYKISFGVIIASIMASYVYFCWEYPHVCTMHIRYIMTAVYIGMLVLGLVVSGIQGRLAASEKRTVKLFTSLSGLVFGGYMLCCVLLMLNVVVLYAAL